MSPLAPRVRGGERRRVGRVILPARLNHRRVLDHSMKSLKIRSCSFGSLDILRATWRAMSASVALSPVVTGITPAGRFAAACTASIFCCIGGKRFQPGTVPDRLISFHFGWLPAVL